MQILRGRWFNFYELIYPEILRRCRWLFLWDESLASKFYWFTSTVRLWLRLRLQLQIAIWLLVPVLLRTFTLVLILLWAIAPVLRETFTLVLRLLWAIVPVLREKFTLVLRLISDRMNTGIKHGGQNRKKKRRKSRKCGSSVSNDGNVMTHTKTDREEGLYPNEVDEGADGRTIGKLSVSSIVIGWGSQGTVVLEGTYEGRAAAVKRLLRDYRDVASKEIQNLIVSDNHPNIVRWYGKECDQHFIYLALERCSCSLDDLIGKDSMQGLWKANGHPTPPLLKLMRDIVDGLVHLHELGIIHRDLKPQNILIIKEGSLRAKLSDMGISKRLLDDKSSLGDNANGCGSSGWQAPEVLAQGRQTRAVDLFSLGCVLFFCITGGRHPFGERRQRDLNIERDQKDLLLIKSFPEAEDLISRLLDPTPDQRPKACEVLHHPFFWSSEMRLSFLRDASDRVELEDRESNSDLSKALEDSAPVAFGRRWDGKLDSAFITDIGFYRRYKFNSVRDLLRVIRNKLNHYGELPPEIQELVGPVPNGFNEYFATRYPTLLIEVYKILFQHCKEDGRFQRFFKNVD